MTTIGKEFKELFSWDLQDQTSVAKTEIDQQLHFETKSLELLKSRQNIRQLSCHFLKMQV